MHSAFIPTHNETLSVAAMCVCNPDRSPVGIHAETQPRLQMALRIVDHLRRRFARFKSATGRTRCGELGAHFLDLRRQLLRRPPRKSLRCCVTVPSNFATLTMCLFQELVEQHRVYRFIANSHYLSLLIANDQVRINLLYFLGY